MAPSLATSSELNLNLNLNLEVEDALSKSVLLRHPGPVRVEASWSERQITVHIYKDERAKSADLKIDTVLIAQILRERFAGDFEHVTVFFFDLLTDFEISRPFYQEVPFL